MGGQDSEGEAAAPDRDVLVRASSDVLTEAFEMLVDALGGRCLRSDGFVACDLGSPAEDLNHVILRQPVQGDRGAAVIAAELRAFFPRAHGHTIWDPWPSVDARALDYAPADVPLMIRPAGGDRPPDPPGLEVREVADRRGLEAFEGVLIKAFPLTGLVAGRDRVFGPRILDHPRIRLWVGWADGRPVATSMGWLTGGHTFVGYIATLAEARGRGCGAALTWRATLADPAAPALLHASTLGRPVYRRIGYETITTARIWIKTPSPAS